MGSQEDAGLTGRRRVLTRTVLHTFIHLIVTRTVRSSHHPQFIIRKMSSKKLSSLYKVTEPGFAVRQRTKFLLLTSRPLTAGGSPRAARVSVLFNFVSLTSELGPLYSRCSIKARGIYELKDKLVNSTTTRKTTRFKSRQRTRIDIFSEAIQMAKKHIKKY